MPIASLVQELLRNGVRDLTGSILDLEEIFSERGARALQRYHNGVLSFLAFDPRIDVLVKEYVATGALLSDTGETIFLLMMATEQPSPISEPSREDLGLPLKIQRGEHHAVTVVMRRFPAADRPVLPGIVFFDQLLDPVEPSTCLFLSVRIWLRLPMCAAQCSPSSIIYIA